MDGRAPEDDGRPARRTHAATIIRLRAPTEEFPTRLLQEPSPPPSNPGRLTSPNQQIGYLTHLEGLDGITIPRRTARCAARTTMGS